MITRPTVIVLGAGASQPYGYPLGGELRDAIGGADSVLRDVVAKAANVARVLVDEFCEELRLSNLPSVDTFIERRQDLAPIGRAAIAAALIHREWNQSPIGGGWYQVLYNEMMSGVVKPEKFSGSRLAVVTFNYDSSFERFLANSLRASFGIAIEEAQALRDAVPVVHVYGSIPSRVDGKLERSLEFTVENVRKAAEGIITLHQGDISSAEFRAARNLLMTHKTVFFLGFGFHPDNVKRLVIQEWDGGADRQTVITMHGLIGTEMDRVLGYFSQHRRPGYSTDDCLTAIRKNVTMFGG